MLSLLLLFHHTTPRDTLGGDGDSEVGAGGGSRGWRMNVAVKKIEKRLIFLGLRRKPIKPLHRTCSAHVGHRRLLSVAKVPYLGNLLERVLEAQAGK